MIEHKAVTLTREEIVEDVSKVIQDILKDNVGDLVGDGDNLSMFENYSGIPNKDITEIGDIWVDFCSDEFFKSHPEVTDVLVIDEEMGNGEFIKSWLASRK